MPDYYPYCSSLDMEPPSVNSISFSILSAESNVPGHQYGYYRILTSLSAIKYLSFLPSKPPFPKFVDDRCDGFGFTTVPGGDWNIGRLEKDLKTGRVVLQSTEKIVLQSVEDVWHPARVDYLSLGDALSPRRAAVRWSNRFGNIQGSSVLSRWW